MMIVRDDYSRLTKVYFLRSQDDTADYFMKNLVNIAPRKVEMAMARSDDRSWVGGGGVVGEFSALCIRGKSKQELTTANTPELNGTANAKPSL